MFFRTRYAIISRIHYAYFLNYYAKNVTQYLCRHYANMITQDTKFYSYITQYIYAKITLKSRKSFIQNTQILCKQVYAVITQLSQFYNHYAFYAIITQMHYADIRK